MKKKRDEGGHGNSERWLLTYADMITLLMAFFIMMYSMSVLNLTKFHQAAISIRSGFGGVIRGQGKSVLGSVGAYSSKPSPLEMGELYGGAWRAVKPLVDYIKDDAKLQAKAEVGVDERGIVVSILSDNMLFESGSAVVSEKGFPLLDKVAEMLDRTTNNVRIEGYTCNLPPRNRDKYPTNWELSTARATNVLRYFVERKGLDGKRFSVAGYAGERPRVPNTSEANRRKNRRVDIVLIADSKPDPEVEVTEYTNLFWQPAIPWPQPYSLGRQYGNQGVAERQFDEAVRMAPPGGTR